VEENEERREEENKGRRRALFQQAQSQRPAELARALETTVSSNVISPYLSFSSFFPVVLIDQCFHAKAQDAEFTPFLLALSFIKKKV